MFCCWFLGLKLAGRQLMAACGFQPGEAWVVKLPVYSFDLLDSHQLLVTFRLLGAMIEVPLNGTSYAPMVHGPVAGRGLPLKSVVK